MRKARQNHLPVLSDRAWALNQVVLRLGAALVNMDLLPVLPELMSSQGRQKPEPEMAAIIHSLSHSCHTYLLSTYCVLSAEDKEIRHCFFLGA